VGITSGSRAAAADVLAIVGASSGKQLVRLVQQSSQSLANDTDVAITFGAGSEDIDTAGWHDVATNTSRITPLTAGYLRLTGTVWWAADTDDVSIYASIGKNGTVVQRSRIVLPSTATASVTRSVTVTLMQQCNGSTDYFELFGRQVQAATGTLSTNVAAGGVSSVFEAEFLRPL
jgi:hypothetical protein